jgi:hypothetical protein
MARTSTGHALTLTALAVALFVGEGLTQQPMSHGSTTESKNPTAGAMTMDPKAMSEMVARGHQMMAGMRAADQKLDELVATMNAARGNDRLDAMAAVISELAAYQKAIGAEIMSMHGMMMSHNPMMNGAPPKDALKEP